MHIRIFGCPVSVVVPKEKQKKWEECSCMGYMVGYEPYSSGYLIWYPGLKQVNKARDVLSMRKQLHLLCLHYMVMMMHLICNVNTCTNAGKITNVPDITPKPPP